MRKIAGMALGVIGLVAISVPLGTTAVTALDASSSPVIVFDDAAHQVQLIIPTPACPEAQPNCQWKFFLNEPKLSVDVATVYGTSGTLTIPYPSNFCGVIQADAYVGPPWVAKRGFQHTIEDCGPTTSPTSVPPDAPTTSTTGAPPAVVGSASQPGPPSSAGQAAPAPASSTASAPVVSSASDAPTQLPFTGPRLQPLLLLGFGLLALSMFLLTTSVSRRRMTRRLGNCPWPSAGRSKRRA